MISNWNGNGVAEGIYVGIVVDIYFYTNIILDFVIKLKISNFILIYI